MSIFVEYSAYFLLAGLVVLGIGMTVLVSEQYRSRVRRTGLCLLIIGGVGLVALVFSTPGRETVEEEERDRDRQKPRPDLTLSDMLKGSWDSDGASDWPVARLMAEVCDLSYRSPVNAREEFKRMGFSSETIVDSSMIGYVLSLDDTAIVVLRGTDDSPDWISNLSFLSNRVDGGAIHRGFDNAYAALRPQVNQLLDRSSPRRVWITGHSLGGALAVMSAYELLKAGRHEIAGVMTFGQPMVVDSDLRRYMKPRLNGKFVHFVNESDPVARIMTPYKHFGTLIWLRNGVVHRSSSELRFGASSGAEMTEFVPLSQIEFEQLRGQLQSTEGPFGSDGTTNKSATGWLPSVSDHYMDGYLRMMRMLQEDSVQQNEMIVLETE